VHLVDFIIRIYHDARSSENIFHLSYKTTKPNDLMLYRTKVTVQSDSHANLLITICE